PGQPATPRSQVVLRSRSLARSRPARPRRPSRFPIGPRSRQDVRIPLQTATVSAAPPSAQRPQRPRRSAGTPPRRAPLIATSLLLPLFFPSVALNDERRRA